MSTPTAVKLVAICPHCGETVEIILTKKEVKEIYKSFKQPIQYAQKKADEQLLKEYIKKIKSKR